MVIATLTVVDEPGALRCLDYQFEGDEVEKPLGRTGDEITSIDNIDVAGFVMLMFSSSKSTRPMLPTKTVRPAEAHSASSGALL